MNKKDKLNLGCGANKKEDFINLDWNPLAMPDVLHNLNQFPYPFEDNSMSLIEADHVLEHAEAPFLVMKELHRILRPAGQLRIRVPHFSRGFTHAEHAHGFDITFPLYFNKDFTRSGYLGFDFILKSMKLRWIAYFHLLTYMGFGKFTIVFLKIVDFFISGLANLSPAFCSRIWCYLVGGFEEIEFILIAKKD